MGVPVLTRLATPHPAARISFLSTVNLPEFIADRDDRFIAIAAQLAEDFSRRSELRRGLRDRIKQSPLMDARSFAQMESQYRQMWRNYCSGCDSGPFDA